jgi:hypothetical protein
LATNFELIQSIISPLYRTNKRYNLRACQYLALRCVFFCGIAHNNYHYDTTVIEKDPLISLKLLETLETLETLSVI